MAILPLVSHAFVRTSKTIIDQLIVKPLPGLRKIFGGIVQAGPDLCRASSEAAVDAVQRRLIAVARENVRQGANRVLAGARLLVAPVAVALGRWVLLRAGVICLGCAVCLVMLAMGVAAG